MKTVWCSACMLRHQQVPLEVGHVCQATELCETCGGSRVRRCIDWNENQGFLTVVDPCTQCVADAWRRFGISKDKTTA